MHQALFFFFKGPAFSEEWVSQAVDTMWGYSSENEETVCPECHGHGFQLPDGPDGDEEECEECEGSGRDLDIKFLCDWYVPGGRWAAGVAFDHINREPFWRGRVVNISKTAPQNEWIFKDAGDFYFLCPENDECFLEEARATEFIRKVVEGNDSSDWWFLIMDMHW